MHSHLLGRSVTSQTGPRLGTLRPVRAAHDPRVRLRHPSVSRGSSRIDHAGGGSREARVLRPGRVGRCDLAGGSTLHATVLRAMRPFGPGRSSRLDDGLPRGTCKRVGVIRCSGCSCIGSDYGTALLPRSSLNGQPARHDSLAFLLELRGSELLRRRSAIRHVRVHGAAAARCGSRRQQLPRRSAAEKQGREHDPHSSGNTSAKLMEALRGCASK